MKRYRNLFTLGLLSLLGACDFGDTNIDPARQLNVELKFVLPAAEAQTARNMGSIGPRVTGTVVQHLVGTDFQPASYTDYLLDATILDEFWTSGLYAGAMKDADILIKDGQQQNLPHYVGIGKILMALNLAVATTYWGDVPYTEAFNGIGNLTPAYDTQESVYGSIQQLLDEAIVELAKPKTPKSPASDDLIFGGNPAKWTSTAYALKARYYMHLTKRDPQASARALEQIPKAFKNLQDQPTFPFGTSLIEAHPIAYFGQDRPNQVALSPFFAGVLTSNNDPRLARYAVLVSNLYRVYRPNNTDLYWGQNNSPMPYISLPELKFLEAEASLRTNDETRAANALREGIEASMLQLGIAPASYTAYLDRFGTLDGLTTFEEKLSRIISQKYIALYAQGTNEVWVDYRRTGFPEITPPAGISTSFNPSRVIPRRYLYPITEVNTNNGNLTSAIERQGGQLLDVDMWAFR